MKRQQIKQLIVSLLVLLLSGVVLAGCQLGASAARPKIVFGYTPATFYAPFFVAEEKGYFDELGLDVELIPKSGTAETYQLLAADQLTAGGSTWGCSFFNAVKQGTLVTVIAPIATMPTTGKSPSPLMVSQKAFDSGEVTSVADLKGKRVGIPGPGGFGEYSTILALQTAGLGPDDVELVNVGPPDAAVALENGGVEAVWTIEPFSTFLEEQGMAKVLSADHAQGVELAFLTFNNKFVEENPDATARFTAAFLRASRELDAGGWKDPQTREIVAKYTELPADVLGRIALTVSSVEGEINVESVQAQETYCRDTGALEYEDKFDLAGIYRKDILEQAKGLLK